MAATASGNISSRKFRVAEKQESFDFALTPMPEITVRGNYTQTPNELLEQFVDGCDSPSAIRLVLKIARMTCGGEFDVGTYGPDARPLRKAPVLRNGRLGPKPRPMWVPLTAKRIAELAIVSESGALKLMAGLEHELKIVESKRADGQIWYRIDYDRIAQLPRIALRTWTPSPNPATNIPTDTAPVGSPMVRVPGADMEIPLSAACPAAACPLNAKYGGLDYSQTIDSIKSANSATPFEGSFQAKSPPPGPPDKTGFEGCFSPQTLVVKPGSDAVPVPLGTVVSHLRITSRIATVISAATSFSGGVLHIELHRPSASNEALTIWRKPLDKVCRAYFPGVLDDADVLGIAGRCEAIGATQEEYCGWLGEKLKRRGKRKLSSYSARIVVRFTEDFEGYWMAGDAVGTERKNPLPEEIEEMDRLEAEVRRKAE